MSGGGGLDVPKLLLVHERGEVSIGPSEDEASTEQAGDRGDGDGPVVVEGLDSCNMFGWLNIGNEDRGMTTCN